MERDDIYRRHILDAIARIEKFTHGLNYEQFCANDLVQAGVVRELEIIGEAAKRLSEPFKIETKQIPWRKITGTRDFLIHDYVGVNLEVVWKTIADDLPSLKSALLEPDA